MTMREISEEYRKAAKKIKERINRLQSELDATTDPVLQARLESRIKALTPMYRDTKELAGVCFRYYDRSHHTNVRYKI